MARISRREIVAEDEVGTYCCVQRCPPGVRMRSRAGTTTSAEEWSRGRLEFLATHFALDILGYTTKSSHLHLVLRNRPDIAASWSDEEVAHRQLAQPRGVRVSSGWLTI